MNIWMFQEKNEKVTKYVGGVLAACETCGCVIFVPVTVCDRFPDTGYWRECPAETGNYYARKEYRYFWRLTDTAELFAGSKNPNDNQPHRRD